MRQSPPSIQATVLRQLVEALFEVVGTPADLAAIVAASLVDANLAGHDSHGVLRVPGYIGFVRSGRVIPAARPILAHQHHATATVDAAWGWGQPAARFATETAINLAAEYGIGAVTIAHCNHIGRVGEYVEVMARAGMTGIALCNTGVQVVPHGGRDRQLGTNPIAWAAPTADPQQPLLFDYATSAVAHGKLQVARASGKPIEPGLIVDAEGRPTTSLDDFFAGGALLPFGGHKGYALGVMVEVLGGALSGAAPSVLPDYHGGNGTLIIAININAFQPSAGFVEQVTRFAGALKSGRPADGTEEITLPGEPEATTRRLRADGIPLPEPTWAALRALALELGVEVHGPLAGDYEP